MSIWQRGRLSYQSFGTTARPGIVGPGAATGVQQTFTVSSFDRPNNAVAEPTSLQSRLHQWLFGSGEGPAAETQEAVLAGAEATVSARATRMTTSSTGSPSTPPENSVMVGSSAAMESRASSLQDLPILSNSGQRWMPDEKCTVCFACNAAFGTFRRRHHCRLCGQIFCSKCSSKFVHGKYIGTSEHLSRLCDDCCTKHCDGLPLSDNADRGSSLIMLQRRYSNKWLVTGDVASSDQTAWVSRTEAGDEPAASVEANSVNEALGASECNEESLSETSVEYHGDNDYDDYGDKDSDSEFDPDLPVDIIAVDPEDHFYLQPHPLPPASDISNDTDYDCTPTASFKAPPQLRARTEIGLPAAACQHLASLATCEAAGEPAAVVEPSVTAAAHNDAWRRITEEAAEYFVRSVRERCVSTGGGIEDSAHILSICELAKQVVDHFAPRNGDSMDILEYVKIKRIPGGRITDSQWIDGVVFTRDVAHRKMRSTISGCHLALLGESIGFDSDDRLTPLNVLREQEEYFCELKVQKIADLQPTPQLLLCQGGVSQIAQEKLRKRNISLVLGVPEHILHAIGRCTGATLLPSVDSIVRCTGAVVGECRHFMVQHAEVGSKPLAVIEASQQRRYCTIVLRGGSTSSSASALQTLSHAKRVLQWAIRRLRHLQLESELLFETWSEPQPSERLTTVAAGADLADNEHLDLICYSVSMGEERTCSRPVMLRLPAYATPASSDQQELSSAQPSAQQGDTCLAGGLHSVPVEGIQDCTLHDWLMRCFMPKHPMAKAASQQLEVLRASSASLHGDIKAATEGSHMTSAGAIVGADELGRSDATRQGGCRTGGSSSAKPSRSINLAPVPSKGEVLFFQHKRSRVVIDVRDQDEPLRGRTSSKQGAEPNCDGTRWALLEHGEEDAAGGGQQRGKGEIRACADSAPGTGFGGPVACSSSSLDTASAGVVQVWRWCKYCKTQVTTRNVLSTSAGWISFTKFLELLLSDSTPVCSPASCPHSSFRHHVLFCSSPQRPIVVGFKWDHVELWQLDPPQTPLFDPHHPACTLSSSLEVPGTAHEPDCSPAIPISYGKVSEFLSTVGDLVAMIGDTVSLLLLALAEEVEPASSMAACGGRAEDAMGAGAREDVEDGEEAHEPLTRVLPPWLRGWVWGNKSTWHKALQHLVSLQNILKYHATIARKRLSAHQRDCQNVLEWDPILLAVVHRDLMDALGEDQWSNAVREAGFGIDLQFGQVASVRAMITKLLALLKLPNAPHNQSFSEERQGSSSSGFGALSTLASGGKGIFRWGARAVWHWSAVPVEVATTMSSGDVTSTLTSAKRVRVRSRSASRSPRCCKTREARVRNKKVRSSSVHFPCAGRQKMNMGRTASCFFSNGQIGMHQNLHPHLALSTESGSHELHLLPAHVRRVCDQLDLVAKQESQYRHATLDRGVMGIALPVDPEDVGSVIAHALLSRQAQDQMAALWVRLCGHGCGCCPLAGALQPGSGTPECSCFFSLPSSLRASAECSPPAPPSSSACQAASSSAIPGLSGSKCDSQKKFGGFAWQRLPEATARHPWEVEWERLGVRKVLTACTPMEPVRVEFADQCAKYSVIIHHAPQFHIIRHGLLGDDLNFVRSLHRCDRIAPSGGKTGAAFFISHDRRFLLKAVTNKYEYRMLTTQADALFWYADQVLFDKLPSVLAQILGLFTVCVTWRHKSKQLRRTFIVQRNLRYNLRSRPHCCFDLKGVGKRKVVPAVSPVPEEKEVDGTGAAICGSDGGAHVTLGSAPAPPTRTVLWDQNFREWTEGRPLCLLSKDLKYLEAALLNDTTLLSSQSVVDYSLLLAAAQPNESDATIDQPGTLSVGIIDYLRPYTWDKQLETYLKSAAHQTPGGPTVIEPADYAHRFLKAMGTFFAAGV